MNHFWPYRLKALYRREPLLAILLTVGTVDLLIGAGSGRVSLLLFGLLVSGGSVGLRWWQSRSVPRHIPRKTPLQITGSPARPPIALSRLDEDPPR